MSGRHAWRPGQAGPAGLREPDQVSEDPLALPLESPLWGGSGPASRVHTHAVAFSFSYNHSFLEALPSSVWSQMKRNPCLGQ